MNLTPPAGLVVIARTLPDACTCGRSQLACDAHLYVRGSACCPVCDHNPRETT